MKPQRLTERQQAILRFIETQVSELGFPPSLREIGAHFGIKSTNGVSDHLRALERKGFLVRTERQPRALRLARSTDSELLDPRGAAVSRPNLVAVTSGGGGRDKHVGRSKRLLRDHIGSENATEAVHELRELITLPVLGRVAAGALSEAIESAGDSVSIDATLVGRGSMPSFALRVFGDSMIESGIFHGDFVFVRKQIEADRGQVVVAMVGDEATCKHYYPERDYIRLQPANATMAPILIPRSEWRSTRIIGVVVGVYRRMQPKH